MYKWWRMRAYVPFMKNNDTPNAFWSQFYQEIVGFFSLKWMNTKEREKWLEARERRKNVENKPFRICSMSIFIKSNSFQLDIADAWTFFRYIFFLHDLVFVFHSVSLITSLFRSCIFRARVDINIWKTPKQTTQRDRRKKIRIPHWVI